VTLISNQSDTM